jgi:hypothetical protein
LPKVDNFLTSSFTNSDLQPGGKGTRKPRMWFDWFATCSQTL